MSLFFALLKTKYRYRYAKQSNMNKNFVAKNSTWIEKILNFRRTYWPIRIRGKSSKKCMKKVITKEVFDCVQKFSTSYFLGGNFFANFSTFSPYPFLCNKINARIVFQLFFRNLRWKKSSVPRMAKITEKNVFYKSVSEFNFVSPFWFRILLLCQEKSKSLHTNVPVPIQGSAS